MDTIDRPVRALLLALQSKVDLLDVVGQKPEHSSHEVPEVEYIVHDVGVLLDDVGECLRINQRNRQFFIERVIIPIHFGESDNSSTGIMPASLARKSANQQRRRHRF
jgi:hypothetical protein